MTQSNPPTPRDADENSKFRKSITEISKAVERVGAVQTDQIRPIKLLNWVGYGLLIFALFDVIEIFSTFQPFNPQWQFQTLGQLIERVAVPLIGFGLVFLGGNAMRGKIERGWLRFLSWLTLLLALLFLLAVPLGVVNTVRLYRGVTRQITAQEQQRTTQAQEQVQAFKSTLETINTPEEMQALLNRLNRQGNAPNLDNPNQIDEVKEQLSTLLDNEVNKIPVQARQALSERRQALIKSSVKWNLSALISSVLFFIFWKGTLWARKES